MTKEDIIRMAREADLQAEYDDYMLERLERFAALVAAAAKAEEREACAQVAMLKSSNGIETAAAIRARGQA